MSFPSQNTPKSMSPQTPLRQLTAFPQTPAGFKRATSMQEGMEGRTGGGERAFVPIYRWEKAEWEGEGRGK